MKILNFYIGRSLLATSAIAIAVLTFVMLGGNVMKKVMDLVARGMPLRLVGTFMLYLLPVMLSYTIPLAVLCAAVLVFSRLSADREITAMRASGVSLWQIIAPGLLLSVAMSACCLFIHLSLGPRCRYRADRLKRSEGLTNPAAFLNPGIVELPGTVLYIGSRDGNELKDISIYGYDEEGVTRDITAREGTIRVHPEDEVLELELRHATIGTVESEQDPGEPLQLRRLAGARCTFTIQYGEALNRRPVTRKTKHMDMAGLFGAIRVYAKKGIETTPLYVELHKRMSMALSPVAFLLIGIPFGIRTRRTETSVGLVVSLVLALFFYVFLVLADTVKYEPGAHPELLVWLPNLVYQVGGVIAVYALARR